MLGLGFAVATISRPAIASDVYPVLLRRVGVVAAVDLQSVALLAAGLLATFPIARFAAGVSCVLYWMDIRLMRIGGGEPYRMFDVVASALALSVGCYAEQPLLVIMAAVVAAVVGVVGIVMLWREKSDLMGVFRRRVRRRTRLAPRVESPDAAVRAIFLSEPGLLSDPAQLSGQQVVARGPLWRAGVVVGLAAIVCGNMALEPISCEAAAIIWMPWNTSPSNPPVASPAWLGMTISTTPPTSGSMPSICPRGTSSSKQFQQTGPAWRACAPNG